MAVSQVFATDALMYGSMLRTKEVFTAAALISNALATVTAEANDALGIDRKLFTPPAFE